jgi:uncharacterized protein YbaR (Trm112 family)
MLLEEMRSENEKCSDGGCSVCNVMERMDKRYEIACPVCSRKLWVIRSIGHLMGMPDFGRASCPDCKEELNVVYNPEEDSMKARKYSEFSGYYWKVTDLPCDLKECFDALGKDVITPQKIEEIKNLQEQDFVTDAHFGLGRWLRNEWELWSVPENSRLVDYFHELGITHADDMSSIILTSYHRHLNGKEIKLEEQIKHYQDYWKEYEEKVV